MRASIATIFIPRIWRLFISLKLTFVLLVFIAIGAVLGMSYDQTTTFEEFYDKHPEGKLSTHLLSFFELYDAFHSWWFSLAILLLAMNLVACSIERLPRIYFDYVRPRPYLTNRRLLGLTLKESFKVKTLADGEALIQVYLPTTLEKARLKKRRGYYYCERQGLSRFGVYVVHIALLIVMFSSIYATQNGVDGHMVIEEGQRTRFITRRGPGGVSYTDDLGFYVGCDDFRLRTFVDNTPMEFESDLFVAHNMTEKLHQKTVRVNEPLTYKGYNFYQSSYRPVASEKVVEIEVADNSGHQERHRVRLNSPIELASKETLVVEKIYEDFAGLGQALRIGKKSRDGKETFFHIFRRHKDYDRIVRGGQYSVSFLDADQKYATGLSIGKVPGIEAIFFGFLVLMMGLYMCFFMTPIRYFARLEERDGEIDVTLAALGYRNLNVVKEIFNKRLKGLPFTDREGKNA